ncbi:adenyl-nucleotide exchange factor sse1, partial [Cryomyces antarcticus]
SYIYELRGKIDEQYSEFASDDEKTKLKEKLEASEDWLYDDGENATKAVYIAKIEEIRAVAGPIVQRYKDKVEEERQAVQRAEEERQAAKKAAADAKRKADEDAKKDGDKEDTEMRDAEETVKPDGTEEVE